MNPIRNVIVVGATGVIGSAIVSALLAANFTVSILVRTTSDKVPKFPPSVTVKTTDYTPASVAAAFENQDAVVSTVGYPGLAAQSVLIDAAASAGVSRFIPSEFGNDTRVDPLPELWGMLAVKRTTLEHLQATADGSGGKFSWTALATGPFMDYILAVHSLGCNIRDAKAVIYDGGATPFTGTLISEIAHAVAQILLRPDETRNKYLRVRSVRTTQNELLASVQKLTGAGKEVEHVKTEDVMVGAREKLKVGDRSAFSAFMSVQVFAMGTTRGMIAEDGEEGMAILGMRDVGIDDVVRAAMEWKDPRP